MRPLFSRSSLAVLTVWLFAASTASAQIAAGYFVSDLGSLAGSSGVSSAWGISSNGRYVTGYTQVAGGARQAFLYDRTTSTMTGLGVLGGTVNSKGLSVNNSGSVVGYSTSSSVDSPALDTSDRAFIFPSGGSMTAIPVGTTANGFQANFVSNRAQGINNAGQVVGYASEFANNVDQGFRYNGTTLTPLGFASGGGYANAIGINTAGRVVGTVDTGSTFVAGTYAGPSGTTPTTLPLAPGYNSAYGYAINDNNQVTGYVDNNGVGATRGFLYNGTSSVVLGTLGTGDQSFGNGLSNANTVVGESNSTPGGTTFRAVIFNGATAVDLNSLLTGAGSFGWVLQSAQQMANDGSIVGYGLNPNGQLRGFLLTPVPEPGTLVLAGLGLGGLAWSQRRRRGAASA